MRLKPLFQLVRLPNLFTAAADALAGWLLAGLALNRPGWALLALASMALYAGGVTLNDVCDEELDRRERPERPLPSGAVLFVVAAMLVAAFLGGGMVLAYLGGGVRGLTLSGVLVAAIVAYNLWLRRTPFGPAGMGACRGLNLLLGASPAAALVGPLLWAVAAAYGLFVAGITLISRFEAGTDPARAAAAPRGIALGLGLEILALAVLGAAGWGWPTQRMPNPVAALVLLGVVAALVLLRGALAARKPAPERVRAAVRAGIYSLVWIDVALVVAARGPAPALAVAACWVPAFLFGRWLEAT